MAHIRFLTAGESHGPAEVAIVEGIPAGLALSVSQIQKELKKRHHDFGRGGRSSIEPDEVRILSGVRFGTTLGSPIALLVENRDFANWKGKMDVEENTSIDKESIKVTRPRPGHADLAGVIKYGFDDVRNVLERASARETVMRVAVGAVCKIFLDVFDIKIASHSVQIGSVTMTRSDYTFADVAGVFEADPEIHCIDKETREKMKQVILNTRKEKNTLGGVIEVIAHNLPVGLGSYVQFDKKLDGRIAGALMSIPSVKAVEIGGAIDASGKTGSDVQDAIYPDAEKRFTRKTNRMGGIEGGVSNGEDIVCRVYHKPLSTLYNPLPTVHIKTGKKDQATIERSDVCVVPRAGVIAESMLAYILTDSLLEKFGGDSIDETKHNFIRYNKHARLVRT